MEVADKPPVTILLVDDNEPKRYTISRVLRKEGFSVSEASTGADALSMAAALPDLIILDVQLPDLSGFEVCRRIKSDPRTESIPVLHLSAVFVGSDDRAHGLDSGADGYLTQKVEPTELLATVRALLRARRAEEAARVAAHDWQVTFDAIRDGICLVDRNTRILRCNRAFAPVIGQPSENLCGQRLREVLGPELPPSNAASILETIGREPLVFRRMERWLQITADPIRNDRGEFDGAVCIVSEITDRKQMEDELRRRTSELVEAHRRKDEFLAMLAHELRNPLAPIRNASLLLATGDLEKQEASETGDILKNQIDHLARLVDDLLDVSRIVRGKVELRREHVELATVIRRAIEASQPFISSEGHVLALSVPEEPIWIDGDPVRLAQVVSNLLNNAAKYMEKGGRIHLAVEREIGGVAIVVADEGMGIAPDILPQIFDLFVQAETSIERAQGGLGIGLTLVKNLTEMHDGTVNASSEGVGRGSVFTVRLPVLKSDIEKKTPSLEISELRPMRVLVIEDNVGAATVLAKLIRKFWGHDVKMAHDGPSALSLADQFLPEIVLCDIGLPGMNGFEVAKQLRERTSARPPLLVALTGYGAEEDRKQATSAGFDEHLVKPASIESLEALFKHEKLSHP